MIHGKHEVSIIHILLTFQVFCHCWLGPNSPPQSFEDCGCQGATAVKRRKAENLTFVSRNEATPTSWNVELVSGGETTQQPTTVFLGVDYPSQTGCRLLSTVWGDHMEEVDCLAVIAQDTRLSFYTKRHKYPVWKACK